MRNHRPKFIHFVIHLTGQSFAPILLILGMSQEGKIQKSNSRKWGRHSKKASIKPRESFDKAEKNTQCDDDEVETKRKFSVVPRFFRKDKNKRSRSCSKENTQHSTTPSSHRRRLVNEQAEAQQHKASKVQCQSESGSQTKKKKVKQIENKKKKSSKRSRPGRQGQPSTPAAATPVPVPQQAPQKESHADLQDAANPTTFHARTGRPKRTYMEEDDDVEISDREIKKCEAAVVEPEPEVEKVSDRRAVVITKFCKNGVREIIKQFKAFKDMKPAEDECKAFNAFEVRNRYADVYCLDATRVILKGRERDDDYIHASFVHLPNSSVPKYICAQGPTEETVADFWHMVMNEDVGVIVMLCQFVEQDAEKCAEYFPVESGETHLAGEFSVHTEMVEPLEHNIITRKITVKHRNFTSMIKTVTHLWWNEWPDHLAPLEADSTLFLLKQIKSRVGDKMALVHCSAGIGRTGTLVAIDFANEHLKNSAKGLTMPDVS
uniref:Protein-tyrosine phosphatase n=1 Tax=Bursaphelenchus xylophilus TaxID=6326 RepID=A0A1I7SGL5_BURXY